MEIWWLSLSKPPAITKKTGHAELVSASAKELPNQVRDIKENSHFDKLNEHKIKMKIPTDLIPVCQGDGKPMTTNLRSDDFFENEGWHKAAKRYEDFITRHEKSQ